MSGPTGGQSRRVVLAAIPFLASMALLGFAVRTGALRAFAFGWPLIQVAGYAMTLRIARGDLAHPLVMAQVVLHWLMLALLVAILVRAA